MKHPVLLHIREHTWLWIAGFAALGLLMAVLRMATAAALSFMVVGVLIMLKSQGTDILAVIVEDPAVAEDEMDMSGPGKSTARAGSPVR